MTDPKQLKIKLYCDGAEIEPIRKMAANPQIQGFTTNPTLMAKAGITDYASFAKEAIQVVGEKCISFEVFSDDFETMEREANVIASWGGNTYTKIPITNTKGESALPLIKKLSAAGMPLNVTALMTLEQVKGVANALSAGTPAIVSVFAGRIADTGIDPVPLMVQCLEALKDKPKAELLWASPRELLNVFQADESGCQIITATPDLLNKLSLVGKDLTEYSLDTVKMFYNDAKKAGFKLV
jgi:transaldolase